MLGVLYASVIVALILKNIFYRLVALYHGYNLLDPSDDIYLYDIPINPINIPAGIIFKKEPGKEVDTQKIAKAFLDRILKAP